MAAKIVDNDLERVSDFDNSTTNVAESSSHSESNESKRVKRMVAD